MGGLIVGEDVGGAGGLWKLAGRTPGGFSTSGCSYLSWFIGSDGWVLERFGREAEKWTGRRGGEEIGADFWMGQEKEMIIRGTEKRGEVGCARGDGRDKGRGRIMVVVSWKWREQEVVEGGMEG